MKWVEIFSMLALLISIWYAAKSDIVTWIASIASCIGYSYIFYVNGQLANFILQFVYIAISLIGYLYWQSNSQDQIKPLSYIPSNVLYLCGIVMSFTIISSLLYYHLEVSYSWIDVVVATLSVIATIFLIYRMLLSWLLWIVIDLGLIGLFLWLNLSISAFGYCIVLLFAIKGYLDWSDKINDFEGI